jgi:hypothetical protein
VAESLIGAKILKRCTTGELYSTVTTLDHKLFIASMEKKLTFNVAKATKLLETLKDSRNNPEIFSQNIEIAKKFVKDYQANYETDLRVCRTFNGCETITNENIFTELSSITQQNGDKDQYILIADQNDVSQMFKMEIITLLEKDGIKIMDKIVTDNKNPSVRKIFAKCSAKLNPKLPNSSDRIVETKCIADIYIGRELKDRKIYTCKSLTDSDLASEDAVNACSGRLKPSED